ncbi:type 1 glutamine amidotransferase domain-containing protein [Mucilaginibacter endophyticus]|uniref:type 1 glutamine amidotransferase domain-containing protein n=1 Tax=Mucilaginibacter endophyticus TaxID=2675003 RepID=UPI000E0E05AB|nr:type 1 glutamine amidotransferase domain-containing protein [Mucilaginibacter endophyticus]
MSTKTKKVLFVVTSHDKMGNIDRQTGLWEGEFAAPYYTLADAGYDITIASPKGGVAPIDPFSQIPQFATDATKRFDGDEAVQAKLKNTVLLSSVSESDYDAIFFPGGHGPMWDLAEDLTAAKLIETFYQHNKPVSLLCHGVVALKHAKAANGEPLIKGKRVAGFTNGEEEAVGLTQVVPFLTEDLMISLGADYQKGDDWSSFSVVDGLLITGQNPQSAELVGEKLLEALTNA